MIDYTIVTKQLDNALRPIAYNIFLDMKKLFLDSRNSTLVALYAIGMTVREIQDISFISINSMYKAVKEKKIDLKKLRKKTMLLLEARPLPLTSE